VHRLAACTAWLRAPPGCVRRLAACTAWLRAPPGSVHRLAACTAWLRAPPGCVHRLAACTAWLRAPPGCVHRLAACTGWLRAPPGCMHRMAACAAWLLGVQRALKTAPKHILGALNPKPRCESIFAFYHFDIMLVAFLLNAQLLAQVASKSPATESGRRQGRSRQITNHNNHCSSFHFGLFRITSSYGAVQCHKP
jgi:hypothetical protein